jgi:hypothetical protein
MLNAWEEKEMQTVFLKSNWREGKLLEDVSIDGSII